jgi:hypothetical protein
MNDDEKKFGDDRDFQGEGFTRRKKENIYIYIMKERKKERKKE